MDTIPERLARLRALMRTKGLSHLLVPSTDEHLNEYVPAWRQRRPWMSGFTGSAGDLLVAIDPAETFLFTDGRYHLQAERELEGTGIALQKVGARDGKPLLKVLQELAAVHGAACVVGHDPMTLPTATAEALGNAVRERGGTFQPVAPNLVDLLWKDRPEPPRTTLLACPIEWTGKAAHEKLADLRAAIDRQGADAFVAVKLDQIAWLTNLRSTDDIPYNPVFEAHLAVTRDRVHLFLHGPESRLPEGFAVAGFAAHEYDEFLPFLARLGTARVSIDPEAATRGVFGVLERNGNVKIVRAPSPIEEAKAIKNDAEQRCMRRANLLASAAKTKALLWLQRETGAGRTVTERTFRERIEHEYAAVDGYRQLSFNTISAAGEHSAIIHYGGADDTPLRAGELFLIDSGIQVDGGTTDDTRAVLVGPADAAPELKSLYTFVLKAHVAGARQLFPDNAPGAMLDAVTRAPLWSMRRNYDHGTGHGVGAFLNVHEGPFGLSETRRKGFAAHGLKAGMITSIEPGEYRPGLGGVRLENLYLVVPAGDGEDGRAWLQFEPLTFVPFEPALIDARLLGERERHWLDEYHALCRTKLRGLLSDDENAQLERLLSG